jgi:hypothetical protein
VNVDSLLLLKHQKLACLICCPNCHADLEQKNATLVSGIPFSATLKCKTCGEVGSVQNLKYLFNSGDETRVVDQEQSFSSGLCIADMDIKTKYFSPGGAWTKEEFYTWSASAGEAPVVGHCTIDGRRKGNFTRRSL